MKTVNFIVPSLMQKEVPHTPNTLKINYVVIEITISVYQQIICDINYKLQEQLHRSLWQCHIAFNFSNTLFFNLDPHGISSPP